MSAEKGRKKLIYIVDDDPMAREMLKDELASNPTYEIRTFNTGEECLRHLNQHPDVIVLDYYLNNEFKDASNGLQILEQIRKADRHIHIIMLSGQEKYGVAMQSLIKGAEHYVMKDEKAFKKVSELINSLKD